MTRTFDAVVIGAGPAGMTAARVIADAGHGCLLIDRMGPGGELMNMGEVHGYAGAQPGTAGPDLIATLLDAAMGAGVELAVDEVTGIAGSGPFTLATSEGPVAARAVVWATGREKGSTGITGEQEYEGRGVSYCANCDGPLYAGKRVVVDGGAEWAVQDAIDLAREASAVVLVAPPGGLSATPGRRDALAGRPNVSVVEGRIVELGGDPSLTSVVVETARGRRTLEAAGLFPCANRRPATAVLEAASIALDAAGNGPPGIYAAGNVRDGLADTIAEAIADGVRAGQYAARWLSGQ